MKKPDDGVTAREVATGGRLWSGLSQSRDIVISMLDSSQTSTSGFIIF